MIAVVVSKDTVNMKVTGNMTVLHTGELHRKLLELLSTAQSVNIEVGDIEETDLTFFQLLCSAHRSFNARNKMLTVTGLKDELLARKEYSGFARHKGCSRDKFSNCILVRRDNHA